MLTSKRREQYRQWITGKINILATAKRLGYKGATLATGVRKVRALLMDMGIKVLDKTAQMSKLAKMPKMPTMKMPRIEFPKQVKPIIRS